MSQPEIRRLYQEVDTTILNGAAVSGVIDFGNYAGGLVVVPSTWTAANIGFKVSPHKNAGFVIAVDESGTPIQISNVATSTSKAYAIPAKLFGANYVQLWSKSTTAATETDTNQGADRALVLLMKA